MCPSLNLMQSQQIELTQEMREGIEIMAMPVLELSSTIQNQAMANPFLKVDESARTEPYFSAHSDQHPSYYDVDSEDVISHAADESKCLESAMLEQLLLDLREPLDISIAKQLISGIDHRGYLKVNTAVIADVLNTSTERVEHILTKLQVECSPAGIGARTLSERLRSELIATGEEDAITLQIIEDHLEQLANGHFQQIALALNVSVDNIKCSLEKIQHLNPHPAAAFDCSSSYVLPEVIVEKSGDKWSIKVRKGLLPHVMLDPTYSDILDHAVLDKRDVTQMKQLMREAEGFIRAIDLRKASIISIASAIVERQSLFFDIGVNGLRAMTMADIANDTGLSESTISRVAGNTSMDTPQGVIRMRYFFHSGVGQTLTQDATSSLAVKQAIQILINGEDKHHPLSDTKLVDLLLENGMNVSRRTVNKYRTALGILSCAKRKSYD